MGQLTVGGLEAKMPNMKVLVLGPGGREHALIRALKSSASVREVHVTPGNDGMRGDARVLSIALNQIDKLSELYAKENYDLVVIGPDQALADGLSDHFRGLGAQVFGPSRDAARLEWSKAFAKDFMASAGIPTARYKIVQSLQEVESSMEDFSPPWVLKADGLALGKGVYICSSPLELGQAAKEIFIEKKFGESGNKAIMEEFKPGWELSLHVMTDGSNYQVFPYARDHKRLLEDNQGPNTGGMGTIAPVVISPELHKKIEDSIVKPAVQQIRQRQLLYRGVLFIGVIVCGDEPYVLEFNSRFGDPEAQVFMPLLDGDWGQVFKKVARGECPNMNWNHLAATCVVLAAPGYPDAPQKGVLIRGELSDSPSGYFLHAGTRWDQKGFVTNGGRVLNAIGIGPNLQESTANAYAQASKVSWDGMIMRRDIGAKR